METTDATEDDAGEVDTEEIAEKKAAESDVPTIQTPIEDVGEADKTTKDGFNVPAAGQANTHGEWAATNFLGVACYTMEVWGGIDYLDTIC